MEIWDDNLYLNEALPRVIGFGELGANAVSYFKAADKNNVFGTLAVPDKNFLADSRAEILKFIADTDWLFAVTDIDDLELAAQVAACAEGLSPTISSDGRTNHPPLVTFLILCPTADDVRLADIPDNFGTWIILPKDKIAETGLTNEEIIRRAVNMTTNIIPLMNKGDNLIGMDFADVSEAMKNVGRACIGFGESLDAENNALQAVKNALKSPLFIGEIRHAKKVLLVFVGNLESISMLDANEAANFLYELCQHEYDSGYFLWQVDVDETASDDIAAFVLATDFDE